MRSTITLLLLLLLLLTACGGEPFETNNAIGVGGAGGAAGATGGVSGAAVLGGSPGVGGSDAGVVGDAGVGGDAGDAGVGGNNSGDGAADSGSCPNIAVQATPSGSNNPSALNDGWGEDQCEIHKGAWLSSGAAVRYVWPAPVTIARLHFDTRSPEGACGSSSHFLSGGYITYLQNGVWVQVDEVSGHTDDWSHVLATPITTTELRVWSKGSFPWIFEWEVYPPCEGT